jgi:hypothetical protein
MGFPVFFPTLNHHFPLGAIIMMIRLTVNSYLRVFMGNSQGLGGARSGVVPHFEGQDLTLIV